MNVPNSAQLAEDLVYEDGAVNARVVAKTLGEIVRETLGGEIQSSRAHVAIRGIRALIHLSDAVRRSSDARSAMLRVDDVVPTTAEEVEP